MAATATTTKLLQNQLKSLLSDPVEGVFLEPNSDNLFEWNIWLEGPAGTPYEGGIFRLLMSFPPEFPMLPPKLKFMDSFWHPNVYLDGRVCISILHPPGEDEMSGEDASERWLPTQSVSSVLLSVLSLLADPNTSSPANVDASVEWRKNRATYCERVAKLCQKTKQCIPPHVVIPHPDSNPEEHKKQVAKIKLLDKPMDMDELQDFMAYDEDAEDFEDDDFGGDDMGEEEEA